MMTNDTSEGQRPQMRQGRPGLEGLQDLSLPNYRGGSIVNIPDSICRWLDIPTLGIGPLEDEILSAAAGPYKRVLLVIIDAVSYGHFLRWTREESAPFWQGILEAGNLTGITSISPSTTCAAMTSLWTGQTAARHGVAGYEMWMKEYNMSVNMIVHGPTTFQQGGGLLSRAGFDPAAFLPLPTLGTHLQAHDIPSHAFQHYSILNSGLSRTFLHDVELHGINTPADMWISLHQLLESRPRQRMYVTAYWGAVDSYFHRFGPGDVRAAAEFKEFTRQMYDYFLKTLSPEARQDTLLLLTADHGQIKTTRNPDYELKNHPELAEMLHITPTGENRLAYLHVQPGKLDPVRQYIADHWPNEFYCRPSRELTRAGLFGPGPYHPRWPSRVGDLTLIARDDAFLWWPRDENDQRGRHGGLSEVEMTVPFLSLPLS